MREGTAQAAPGIRRWWTTIALVILVGVVGLAGSWAATAGVGRAQQRHAAQLMDQHTAEVSTAVGAEAQRYRDTLSDLAVAVGAQSTLTRDDFLDITSKLTTERLPGAAGVSFTVPAGTGEVAATEAFWRTRGAPDLTLSPTGTDGRHLFGIFSRTLDNSVPRPGRDLSQAPEAADALTTARTSRLVTASHPYVLLKDRALAPDRRQMSFVLAAPVIAGAGTADAGGFRGWIVMGLRAGDFIKETLRSQSDGAVDVTLADLSATGPVVVARMETGNAPAFTRLIRQQPITVGQKTWQLTLKPTDALLLETDQRLPDITLGIALLISLLMVIMTGMLAGARNRAMNKVDEATAALRADIRRREATEVRLREREAELRHLALHDPLTGLANRVLFQERVGHAIDTHSRSTLTLAVLFVDLDGFKLINDSFGHSVGDEVLKEVASRLTQCMRGADTVARLGGDEFAVLAENIGDDDANLVADRIVAALRRPFEIGGEDHRITASIGVARHEHGAAADDTIRRADDAMYSAKAAGKNHYAVA